ncbi:hypothetical protein KP509_06G086000 [Ceratopteris richardii]|uniref:Uncharacterized protein n=1 Tax=Ceratopteris richardii TaxID=49495 RepID=A0A8T2UQ18_CERRI|nr:hypothetical protein KP509_06G086000 [Ceratopteris richardii]
MTCPCARCRSMVRLDVDWVTTNMEYGSFYGEKKGRHSGNPADKKAQLRLRLQNNVHKQEMNECRIQGQIDGCGGTRDVVDGGYRNNHNKCQQEDKHKASVVHREKNKKKFVKKP